MISVCALLMFALALPRAGGVPAGCTAQQFADDFEVVSFSNNDGDLAFSTPWQEEDPTAAGPINGSIKIVNGQLKLRNLSPELATKPSAARTADLHLASHAELHCGFQFHGENLTSNDEFVIQISASGASFTTLDAIHSETYQPGFVQVCAAQAG